MDPYRITGPACVSFSGGRTSGLMLYELIEANGGALPADTHVLFANTGRERDETLDFVFACSVRFGVPITWVEYDGRNGRLDYREVDAQTCARDGEPFERLTDHKNALPNLTSRWCTQTLKVERIRAFMRSRGYEHWTDYVGLRADEPGRVTKRKAAADDEVSYAMPLYDAGVTEPMVRAFWRAQSFDLQLESNEGNCDLCFMKGPGVLRTLIAARPELAAWWLKREHRTKRRFSSLFTYEELRDAALIPVEQLTGRARSLALADAGEIACACTD